MDSHSPRPPDDCVVEGKGEKVGEVGEEATCGMEEHGQASPMETPSMAVRDGQIEFKPVMRTFQRTGKMTMGVDDACVVGCDKR